MKIWVVKFNGHYPVGACAVVAAETVENAQMITHIDLKLRGLEQEVPLSAFEEFTPGEYPHIHVILDGEY